MTLTIHKKNFIKDGKPFFYLADTCWSAFTNIPENDWHYYLQYRKRQGYNVLQINILPQWDASGTDLNYVPYVLKEDGGYDFTKINDDYFQHAKRMCEIAKEYNFELALVALWCNYVPKTWANNMLPLNTMPFDCVDRYIEKVDETFTQFNPIYIISGDTDLNEEITRNYYNKASDLLREAAPQCIQTLNVRGRLMEIPEEMINRMDFYMFQSGHNAKTENLCMTYRLPEYFVENYPGKPLINSEPCYEQMGSSGRIYGRHHRFNIRRAAWQSLLSGACSGITYGAAGIYSWHIYGKNFGSAIGEGFDMPNPWQQAIHYPGAWEYGDIKHIFNEFQVTELISKQKVLLNNTEEIRVACTPDEKLMMIYLPENTTIKLNYHFSEDDECTIIDLNTLHRECGRIYNHKDICYLDMHVFEHDVLYIIRRK